MINRGSKLATTIRRQLKKTRRVYEAPRSPADGTHEI
jgi:hypothetical protein